MENVLTIEGRKFAVIPLEEYERLMGRKLPPLPDADERGRRPARQAIRATVARGIIERRLAAGLSQKELARRAGVSPETLSRIEGGKHRPQAATLERLAAALEQ